MNQKCFTYLILSQALTCFTNKTSFEIKEDEYRYSYLETEKDIQKLKEEVRFEYQKHTEFKKKFVSILEVMLFRMKLMSCNLIQICY